MSHSISMLNVIKTCRRLLIKYPLLTQATQAGKKHTQHF